MDNKFVIDEFCKFVLSKEVSIKAKGMYWVICAMHDNGIPVSLASISEVTSDGQTSIRSAIKELIDSGALERVVIKNGNLNNGYEYRLK